MKDQCIITITTENIDDENNVKDVFTRMAPWFTRRHGVESGKIEVKQRDFNHYNGTVDPAVPGTLTIEWEYKTIEE